jgi:leader peptidase (prepilin peptidase) / N-methyltransferase
MIEFNRVFVYISFRILMERELMFSSLNIMLSQWYVYFIFGLIFGSFLNVVIYRVPNGLSIVSPPSSCPKCGHRIKWYENVPILSWIFLRAKCSSCGLSISAEYPFIELITGILTAGLFFFYGPSPALLVLIPLTYTLLCITVVDYKTYSIPHGLNIALFIIAVAGVILNLTWTNFTGVGLLGSVAGGLTGFATLYLLQLTGKIIYKQDAMGTGDLYLLGSAGLLLGPKSIFLAFIFGSILAVVFFSVPSIINLMKRKRESEVYKSYADILEKNVSAGINEKLDLLGVRLQISYNLKDGEYEAINNEISGLISNPEVKNISLLRLFFRFSAVKDIFQASDVLKKISVSHPSLVEDIKTVVNEDLIGYDSPKDNFDFLMEKASEYGINELKKLAAENKNIMFEAGPESEKISDVENLLTKISGEENKLEYLLKQNRFYQFNGYIAEQKRVVELIQNTIDLKDPHLNQRYLSELSFVYFKDFFFEDSSKCFGSLKDLLSASPANTGTVKSIYNIALFRIYFYKQRLAFGPFLAAGIMISLLWGESLLRTYLEFLQGVLF